jgi:molecular chaperone GrpE
MRKEPDKLHNYNVEVFAVLFYCTPVTQIAIFTNNKIDSKFHVFTVFDFMKYTIYNADRMVNEKDFSEDEIEITDDDHHEIDDIELSDEEATGADKLKQLRQKIARLDEEKRQIMEEAARERADFMNARKRLEGERALDKVRYTKRHIEALLPLADSFEMARANKEAWEKADENWRKGIEGIHTQLSKLIDSHGVTVINPIHEDFDPYKHEAIGTAPVGDKALDHKVVDVLQKGYEIDVDGTMEVIRPARVTTGTYSK